MKKLRITVEGKTYDVTVEVLGETGAPATVSAIGPAAEAPAALSAPASGGGASIVSQLAGTVVSVAVEVGQPVTTGDTLLVIEAMKMNTPVVAPSDGTVGAVSVAAGDSVEEGQTLVTLT